MRCCKAAVTSTLYEEGHINITTGYLIFKDNVKLSCCNKGCLYNREGYNSKGLDCEDAVWTVVECVDYYLYCYSSINTQYSHEEMAGDDMNLLPALKERLSKALGQN
ncbi:hypothetical protein KOW79_005276 [Hemibagrus wyckioides]|uniref:Uncharacterized protein n=1 Tax=Hemibagrus wyckioides TaxID=337641 RepID=A0A9D3P2G9_9TELE|nr:hypothetical protein KOW79_005276 [Hemibagrus wyckioides]